MKRYLITLALLLACANTLACSCVDYPTLEEKYKAARIVAIMESQTPEEYIKEGWKHKKFKFVTLETLKGEPLPEYELIESEPRSSCSVDAEPKSKYLVFHNEGKTLSFGHCGLTERLEWLEMKNPDWRSSFTPDEGSNESLQLEADKQKRSN